MLVEKAIVISGQNSPEQNSQGPGYLTWGSLRIQTRKEKVLEGERGADSTYAEAGSAMKIQREQEKENGHSQSKREDERTSGMGFLLDWPS